MELYNQNLHLCHYPFILYVTKSSFCPYVFVVDGVHRSVIVNHLRKFHLSIAEVNVINCSMIGLIDSVEDFGRIISVAVDAYHLLCNSLFSI